eukprot:364013-Chlamydomonas_euryale.AAC.6
MVRIIRTGRGAAVNFAIVHQINSIGNKRLGADSAGARGTCVASATRAFRPRRRLGWHRRGMVGACWRVARRRASRRCAWRAHAPRRAPHTPTFRNAQLKDEARRVTQYRTHLRYTATRKRVDRPRL